MQVTKLFSKSALCCAVVISALTLSTAYAEGGFKVGYVSLDRLIAESAPAKKARATLDKEFKSREKNLEKNATSLRDAQQKYEKDFPNLTDEQRAARETEIGKNVEAFEAERTAFETDLSNAQNKLLQDLLPPNNLQNHRMYSDNMGQHNKAFCHQGLVNNLHYNHNKVNPLHQLCKYCYHKQFRHM